MVAIIFIDIEKKPTRKEILKQIMTQKPIIDDEEAFLRHLIRKWTNE